MTSNLLRGGLTRLVHVSRSEAGPLAAILLLALALLAYLRLVVEVIFEGEAHGFDWALLNAFRVPGHPHNPIGPAWLEMAMVDLTSLGSVAVLVVIAVIAVGFLLIRKRAAAALLVALSLGGGMVVTGMIKSLYGRERPPIEYRALEVVRASFPSGHAMLSAATFLTLGVLLARALPQKRQKIYVMGVAVFLTLMIGVTRVYLGVHWATDVLAGWSVGAAWAMACWLASFAWERVTHRSLEGTAEGRER